MVVDRFMLLLLPINQEYSHPARVESVDIPGIDCDVWPRAGRALTLK